MAKLQLSFACGLYDRMQPLYTGEVKVEGIDLNFIAIDQPRPIFDRMAGGEEFDVAEFSSSEFVQRFANKRVSLRRHPGLSVARLSPRLHRRPPQGRHQGAQGPRGQARGRAVADHDCGHLHQRAAAARIRRRSPQDSLGAGRHEYRGRPRQPDGAAPARADADRAEHVEQVDERPDRGTRGRRHAGHQPAGGDPHQPGHRAAVSELCGAREGVLPAHQDLSDHAPGRHPQADLREISVRRDQPLQRILRSPRRSRWRRCSICGRCAT